MNDNAPMGSTQNVGVSVRGGRIPEEYDSSPMLLNTHKKNMPHVFELALLSALKGRRGGGGRSQKDMMH